MTAPTPAGVACPASPRLRRHRELITQLTALHHWDGDGPTAEFYRGAATALAWLITGGPGPLTGRGHARPVTALAVLTELAHADELTHTARPRRRHYLIGLEHALLWAGHDTTVAPLPAPAAPAVTGLLSATYPATLAGERRSAGP